MILNFELFKAVQRVFAMDESSPLKWTEIITFLWENLIFFPIFSNKMDRIHVPFKEKEKKKIEWNITNNRMGKEITRRKEEKQQFFFIIKRFITKKEEK